MNEDDKEYMKYLDEVFDNDGYGLLLYNGDPIAFEIDSDE